MSKIIDQVNEHIEKKTPFFSLEYFPPKKETPDGVKKLFTTLKTMASYDPQPLFMDVTWGAGGNTADMTVEICTKIQQELKMEANMHLTCTNMPTGQVKVALDSAKKAGIRNVCALRGDPPAGEERWTAIEGGFSYAVDLVRYIKQNYGDYFCISVAGYPEGHPECTSLEADIKHLKEKIDAGADFIITQLFYDADLFINWVKKVREAGITCPIVPGMMPIMSYGGFKRMTGLCKTKVPAEISQQLEAIKDNDEKVQQFGVDLCVEMCRKIVESGLCPGLHFYTLNRAESTRKILEGLNMIAAPAVAAAPVTPAPVAVAPESTPVVVQAPAPVPEEPPKSQLSFLANNSGLLTFAVAVAVAGLAMFFIKK